ncbi:prephenate dehydrogenase/arogenate dehydrogenase family protein [Piscinibacter sakaiensis]|uniref:prephenate dehydrogenase n=1 Tax=Piscinibacter sakaiensis TaxID=1547922 RepID=UPI0006B55D24|nr:prephenate dehydrogenase/arogenate dehydrogenase family protein [Piscinibacter sakaiensis]
MTDTPALYVPRLAVIGCGLIGGSFALALRAAGLVGEVVGHSASPRTLEKALALGAIDRAAESSAAAVAGAHLVLVSVPVSATESVLRAVRDGLEPEAMLMDVGSTKRDVVDAARRVLRDRLRNFVPAHPIAGKEMAGISHADARLFQGRPAILTPIAQTDPGLLRGAEAIWSALGAQVRQMSPENHDATFAAVSHLPHLLAFAYFNAMLGQPAGQDYLPMGGSGFRDFTRIAASDPQVWRDILSTNREEVLKQCLRFRHALDAFEHVIRGGNLEALEGLIRVASEGRSHWQPLGGKTAGR